MQPRDRMQPYKAKPFKKHPMPHQQQTNAFAEDDCSSSYSGFAIKYCEGPTRTAAQKIKPKEEKEKEKNLLRPTENLRARRTGIIKAHC